MDLQLSDEQRLLTEAVEELLVQAQGDELWQSLVDFGALDTDDIGAVELALVTRSLGARLAAVPYVDTPQPLRSPRITSGRGQSRCLPERAGADLLDATRGDPRRRTRQRREGRGLVRSERRLPCRAGRRRTGARSARSIRARVRGRTHARSEPASGARPARRRRADRSARRRRRTSRISPQWAASSPAPSP